MVYYDLDMRLVCQIRSGNPIRHTESCSTYLIKQSHSFLSHMSSTPPDEIVEAGGVGDGGFKSEPYSNRTSFRASLLT